MGLFLAISGVIGTGANEVANALLQYVESRNGKMKEARLTTDDDDCLVLSEGIGGTSVVYPGNFYEWDEASQYLSKALQRPVFSFHIHDDDFWMYILFQDGNSIDKFNPIPDYWGKVKPSEIAMWKGDAQKVLHCIRIVPLFTFEKYLVRWDSSNDNRKAYPSDQYGYGNSWQLIDFIDKFGLDYPVDDTGSPHGMTYLFRCAEKSEEA